LNNEIPIATKYDQLVLINIIEEFVKKEAKKTMKEMGACNCETCYFNVCSIALNNLPPKYVTTTRGALLSRISANEINHSSAILVEVTKAVIKVMQNPRHNNNRSTSL